MNINYANRKAVFSFCAGRLHDVRTNNVILTTIATVMDSGRDNGYVICDKYSNSLESLANNDYEYRSKLGYSPTKTYTKDRK